MSEAPACALLLGRRWLKRCPKRAATQIIQTAKDVTRSILGERAEATIRRAVMRGAKLSYCDFAPLGASNPLAAIGRSVPFGRHSEAAISTSQASAITPAI